MLISSEGSLQTAIKFAPSVATFQVYGTEVFTNCCTLTCMKWLDVHLQLPLLVHRQC